MIHPPYCIDYYLQLTNIWCVLNLLKVEHLVFLLFFSAHLNMLSCLSEARAAQQQKILPDQYSKHDTYSFANIMEAWPTLHKPNDANKGLKPSWAILHPFTIHFCGDVMCFLSLSKISFKRACLCQKQMKSKAEESEWTKNYLGWSRNTMRLEVSGNDPEM